MIDFFLISSYSTPSAPVYGHHLGIYGIIFIIAPFDLLNYPFIVWNVDLGPLFYSSNIQSICVFFFSQLSRVYVSPLLQKNCTIFKSIAVILFAILMKFLFVSTV